MIQWNSEFGIVTGKGNSMGRNNCIDFLETLESNFLKQHVFEPTFGKNVLDQVITEETKRIYVIGIGPQLSSSNKNKLHAVLSWEYFLVSNIANHYLEQNFLKLANGTNDIEEQYKILIEVYKNGVSEFIPSKKISIDSKLTRRKYKLHLQMRTPLGSSALKDEYKAICKKLKLMVKATRRSYEEHIIREKSKMIKYAL
ncbi:hypothetical protein BpHYR1_016425 [Brachionus plicatilis]|uniref:RNA-directed DNA polymerase from mobile element jockey-like n=1 Tax=Brachionus plicatilis TaxID=10195 RepID=A0A3M7PGP3_BRAPC|nr:hypothetical protein BpHYR1_016425 [Brachionus plicatilis]